MPLQRTPEAGGVRLWHIGHRAARGVSPDTGHAQVLVACDGPGHMLECAFCPDCGSRLWHQRRGTVETISVKGGSLDEPVDLRRAVHIWTSRMLPGIIVPEGAAQFPGEPE